MEGNNGNAIVEQKLEKSEAGRQDNVLESHVLGRWTGEDKGHRDGSVIRSFCRTVRRMGYLEQRKGEKSMKYI